MKKVLLAALAGIALAVSCWAQDERPSILMFGNGEYEASENAKPLKSFTSIADVMQSLPALPTVEQIVTPQAKAAADKSVYTPFNLALQNIQLDLPQKQTDISRRIENARLKQAEQGAQAIQQHNSNVNAGLMPSQQEMMQIVMSSGIDIENASEQQIMDVMASAIAPKWGVSKQEYLKIIGMAQSSPKQAEAYIKSNHPALYNRLYAANAGYADKTIADDPRDERFEQIGEQLREAQEQFVALLDKYRNVQGRLQRNIQTLQTGSDEFQYEAGLAGDPMVLLGNTLFKEWSNSAEAKQIDAIEKSLGERLDAWMSSLSTEDAYMANIAIKYPDWWTAEKKKENAIIDQWNKKSAARWLDEVKVYHTEFKAIFDKAAALEAENEQLDKQGEADNVKYLMNKQLLIVLYGELLHIIYPYQDALHFPCIERQPETGEIPAGGKG